MNMFYNCICYPFKKCCPCLDTNKTIKTKPTVKTGQTVNTEQTVKTEKTGQTEKSDKTPKTETTKKGDQKTTESLTKEYKIPVDYKNITECFESQGLIEEEKIAQGGYSTVLKVKDKTSGEVMACKIISLKSQLSYQSSMSELSILIRCKRNVNIIQVKKHFILKDTNKNLEHFFIFMEFANGGNIWDRMKFRDKDGMISVRRLEENIAKEYLRQTVNGLHFLHSLGIAHKDLKLMNILVFLRNGAKDVIKITDFGLSGIRFDDNIKEVIKDTEFVGTLEYMSPQILKLYIYYFYKMKLGKLRQFDAFRADSWALGVCLYTMVSANNPFEPKSETFDDLNHIYNQMIHRKYKISENTKKFYSKDCLTLISDLLEPNPGLRLPINAVSTHKWLKQS